MLQLLKLLPYLQEINLSPADALALLRRIETHSCRAEDYEVLIKMVRAHTAMAVNGLLPSQYGPNSPLREHSSPPRQAKRQRQAAKASRRRRRR